MCVYVCAHVCMCVFVCVRERDRQERERVCVREREREREEGTRCSKGGRERYRQRVLILPESLFRPSFSSQKGRNYL